MIQKLIYSCSVENGTCERKKNVTILALIGNAALKEIEPEIVI